jgi:hypothetical protein
VEPLALTKSERDTLKVIIQVSILYNTIESAEEVISDISEFFPRVKGMFKTFTNDLEKELESLEGILIKTEDIIGEEGE